MSDGDQSVPRVHMRDAEARAYITGLQAGIELGRVLAALFEGRTDVPLRIKTAGDGIVSVLKEVRDERDVHNLTN